MLRNGKISILIEQKLVETFAKIKNSRKNEVENFVENASKFAKILNENERISFIHFTNFAQQTFRWKP